MKNGFTLIELLAVIVILAIIAVIATPIVLNIINDTKESALLRSADFYLEGVETSIATSVLKGITIPESVKYLSYPDPDSGEIEGSLSGSVIETIYYKGPAEGAPWGAREDVILIRDF